MLPLDETLSVERQIVLYCSGVKTDNEQALKLKTLLERDVDWIKVLDIAIIHGLLFFLYRNLKTLSPERVPDEISGKLKNYYLNNSTRNIILSARLVRITSLLAESGIIAVPFKGPVQAEIIYGDIGFRSFSDLDILVSRNDAVKARDLLLKNGFFSDTEIPDNQLDSFLHHENFFNLHDKTRTVVIDLHWEITGRYSLCPVYLESISDRIETIKLLDQDVFSLGLEDMLIYLCIHSTSHCWEKLEMICSVAEIVKSGKLSDWEGIEKRAAFLKSRKMLYLGLALARDLFDVDLPEALDHRINKSRLVIRLEKQILNKLFTQKKSFLENLSWRFSTLHFFIRDTFFDSVRYGLRLLFRPTIREWADSPLPSKFIFLYYILRPFRLFTGLFANFKILPENNIINASIRRFLFFFKKKETTGNHFMATFFVHLPLRVINKIWMKFTELINISLFNRFSNNPRFEKFQRSHQSKSGNHYYIIVMPGVLHLLEPCLRLVPDDITVLLILNGVSDKETRILQEKFSGYPIFRLELFPGTSLLHGRVLNLFFKYNNNNFGIIDYDLFIFNNEIFKKISLGKTDFVAGIFKLKNEKAGFIFPTTHFMYFNTKLIKTIMSQYKIGAHEYKRIPFRIRKKLLSINLGYHNFLKDYLQFFDTLNLIMAMAFYLKYTARIIPINENDCCHIGGGNPLKSDAEYMENLNLKIKERFKQHA